MQDQQLTKECQFHGHDYIISINSQDDILSIELEQKYDTSLWRNTFSSAYIEDLTQKTGSRKSYAEFIKMLVNAIRQPNLAHLTLDILTYQDLENMKNEKKGGTVQNNQSSNSNIIRINKRYIILTQLSENDKYHFPLSLNFEENIDIDKLKKTFTNLKTQLDTFRNSKEFLERSSNSNFFNTDNKSQHPQTPTQDKKFQSTNSSIQSLHPQQQQPLTFEQLKTENEMLRSRVQRIENISSQQKGAIEMDQLIKDKFQIEEDYEHQRKVFQAEYERLNTTLKSRETELAKKKSELSELRNEMSYSWQGEEAAKRIRACILKISEESEKEIQQHKKTIQNQQKELDKLNTEFENIKMIDKKQKNRVRQLELNLENAQKKVVNKGVSDRLYSPSNKQSPSVSGRRANSVPTKSYSPANRTMPGKISTPTYKQESPKMNQTTQNSRQTPPGQSTRVNPSYNYNFKRDTNNANTRSNPSVTNKTNSTNYSPQVRNTTSSSQQQLQQQRQQPSYTRPQNQSPGYQRNTQQNQSPGYMKGTGQQNPSPGVNRNQQSNPSPGTRFNNYMNQNQKNTIQSKIEQQKKQLSTKNVPREFSDKHLSKPSEDLDNRLNKLESLLNKAKN